VHSQRGFSLIEVLVAAAIVAGAVAALAQLAAMAAAANATSTWTTAAAMLAADKMEQLRGMAWAVDHSGLAVSDPRLAASPADSLRRNIAGFCDFLDLNGRRLDEDGAVPPAAAAYTRRWSIAPLPADPNNVLVLQVLVTRRAGEQGDRELPDGLRLTTIRARKAG
jgi:prepilin-type N-terminal cleavage/methylation domain-containing protein